MKLTELQALIDKHTADGNINVDELNKDINASFDAVIEKKVTTAMDGVDVNGYKATGVAEFLKKFEFDNEDSFGAYVVNAKQGETELSQKATRLENEKRTLDDKVKSLEGEKALLIKAKTQVERINGALTGDVKIAPEFVEFVVDKVSKSLGKDDDYNEALTQFVESNPQYSAGQERPDIGKPAGGRDKGGIVNPFAKETRNLAAQTKMFRENPDKAKELARQAGVKI